MHAVTDSVENIFRSSITGAFVYKFLAAYGKIAVQTLQQHLSISWTEVTLQIDRLWVTFLYGKPFSARSQITKLLRLQRAGHCLSQGSERSMGSALDVLNERIAELLYARIETFREQLRTRTALGTRLRTFGRTESGPKTPLLSTPSPRALETQRGRGCDTSMVALLA